MELHEGETILFEGHPSWRSALLFFVKGFAIALIAGVVVALLATTAAGVAAGVAVVAVTIVASAVIRWATDYMITTERLHIRRGIVARNIDEARLARVQNVGVDQNLWQRLLRIGDVEFDTASDGENAFVFSGIANPDAVRAAVDKAHRLAEHQPAGTGRSGL